MRRSIPPAVAKLIRNPPTLEFRQPLAGDRGSRYGPAQSFYSLPILATNGHAGVQTETLHRGTLLSDSRLHVLHLDAIAEAHHSFPSP
jgi:hypothetical protein